MRVRDGQEEVWLCCGDRQQGRIAIISFTEGEFHVVVPRNDVSPTFALVVTFTRCLYTVSGGFSSDQCGLCEF